MPTGAKQAHDVAARRSHYPHGARHEVQSVAMIESLHEAYSGAANRAFSETVSPESWRKKLHSNLPRGESVR
jgi:hypothetical protein